MIISYHSFFLLHILGLLVWLGPSTGGYYVYWSARRAGPTSLVIWTMKRAHVLYDVEHVGLALLLIGGAGMLATGRWVVSWPPQPGDGWLVLKLILVAAVILPFEALDIYVVNFLLGPTLQGAEGQPASTEEESGRHRSFFFPAVPGLPPALARAVRAHDRLVAWAYALFFPAVLVIMYLAIWKPW
ncbi:MAG: hypothetical protein M0031_05955 [Thermaerobacter sp.]|nr:hypothetical protein [Thermaerobacter sp.]